LVRCEPRLVEACGAVIEVLNTKFLDLAARKNRRFASRAAPAAQAIHSPRETPRGR
jgi:hypothetical protein